MNSSLETYADRNMDQEMSRYLRLWYRFEETRNRKVADLSGNNFHGEYVNTPVWKNGVFGSSFSMDGSSNASPSCVKIPNGVLKDLTQLTIAIRMKWTNSALINQYLIALGIDNQKHFYVTPKGRNGKLYSAFTYADGSLHNQNTNQEQGLSSDNSLAVNQWKYLVITLNSDTKTSVMYVDGHEVARNTKVTISPSDFYDSAKDYSGYIGKSFRWDPSFIGDMNEVRIYSLALSSEQIAALTYAGISEEQILIAAKADLELFDTSVVTRNMNLPTTLYGADIVWSSADHNHLRDDGVITRPDKNKEEVTVNLTANITKDNRSVQKSFDITILPDEAAPYRIDVNAAQKGVDISPCLDYSLKILTMLWMEAYILSLFKMDPLNL